MDTYLAHMADATGLTKHLEIAGLSILDTPSQAREFSDPQRWGLFWGERVKEKATAVEALIAAVYVDSDFDHEKTKEVMRGLGVYWPRNTEQRRTMEGMWMRLKALGVVGPRDE